MYIKRSIHDRIMKVKKGFPVVSITGPRQSGKTTYLRHEFPDYRYFNLEDIPTLLTIKDDPKGFFDRNDGEGIIIDEVQRFSELFSYIQVYVDRTQKLGDIFISGSQNLLVSEKISQSLAGRVAYQTIFPLSINELKLAGLVKGSPYEQMFTGGYPALYTREVGVNEYFSNYIATYAERDVRQIRNIAELTQFQNFMVLLAGRVGQLLNISDLARNVGISPNTVEDWISILEASYIVYRLRPYYRNIGKRLTKSPKLYFYDTGLLAYLLKIQNADQLQTHYLCGNIFENFVITEIHKALAETSANMGLSFYRDSAGNEIDLLLDTGSEIIPIEIKISATYREDFLKGIRAWGNAVRPATKSYIIYTGNEELHTKDARIIPWANLRTVFDGVCCYD